MKNKKIRRQRKLEDLASRGEAFCLKHKAYLTLEIIRAKKCYTSNHGRCYCKYVTSKYYGN